MLEKLGKKTAFIGKVGKDMFGEQLKTAVEEVGIDTRNLVMDEEVHTTLAFVHTYPDESQMRFSYNPQQTFPSRCRLKFLYETGIL